MKPDGLSNEMDEGEIVPNELFCALGLLVVESRVPHLSQKGRVDGPHCPSTAGDGAVRHDCSPANFLCGRAEAIHHQMQVLWKNHIPMCIEVLLYPDCEHGSQRVTSLDVTLPSNHDSCILLEQWTIQVLPRRGGESVARARELFQAMKSYLHFSQFSAWLNLTQGKAPRNVSYRVSPPGEFCTSSFQQAPEWHTFPACSLTKSSTIKVTVGALPRHRNIIHVPCQEPHPMGHFIRTTTSEARPAWPQPAQAAVPSAQPPVWPQKRAPKGVGAQYRQPNQWQKGSGGREGPVAIKQPPWRSNSSHNSQIRTKKMTENFEADLEKDTRNRRDHNIAQKAHQEAPIVPKHLDLTKRRSSPRIYNESLKAEPPEGLMDERPALMPHQVPPSRPSQPQTKEDHQNTNRYHYQKRFSSPTVPTMEQVRPPFGYPYSRPHQYPQTPEDMPSYYHTAHLGAIPKRVPLLHKSPPNSMENKMVTEVKDLNVLMAPDLQRPNTLLPPPSSKIKAQSPKVLFSKKSPGQVYYPREDPRWVAAVSGRDSTDSDGSSPEIDKFLKNMTTMAQPLSSEEIQGYLSQLSHHHQSRSRKDVSPLVRRSITEKDFANAEAKEHEGGMGSFGNPQQGNVPHYQISSKLQRALTEANRDLGIKQKLLFTDQPDKVLPKWASDTSSDITGVKPKHKEPDQGAVIQKELSATLAICKNKDEELLPKLDGTIVKTTEIRNQVSSKKSLSFRSQDTLSRTKDAVLSSASEQLVPDLGVFATSVDIGKSSDTLKEQNGTVPIPRRSRTPSGTGGDSSNGQKPGEFCKLEGANLNKSFTDECDTCKPKRSMSPLTRQLQRADSGRQVSPLISGVDSGSFPIQEEKVTNGAGLHDERSTSEKTTHANTDALTNKDSNNHCTVKFSIGEDNDDEENIVVRGSVQNGISHHHPDKASSGKLKDIVSSDIGQTCQQDLQPTPGKKLPVLKSDNVQEKVTEEIVFQKARPLLRSLIRKEMSQQLEAQGGSEDSSGRAIPTPQEKACFRRSLDSSTNMIFHAATGLPLQSSPAPIKKRTSGCFDYDGALTDIRAIKNSLSCANLGEQAEKNGEQEKGRFYSASAPASTNCLLGNFEESLLNGRIEPSGVVEGFSCEIGASGTFCPKHVTLPVTAFFFNLSDDNAPSPYLGHINLDALGRRGYHIPKKGTVQVTLFNPNKTVVKMFVVMYNLTDMPANCQTFLRQRTLYMPIRGSQSDHEGEPVFLRYLIHLRFSSSKSGKIYLHTDIRMIFARDKFEYDSSVANYELRSFTEGPVNPKFSPKR